MSKSRKYKAKLSIEVDLDEYPVPSDGRIKEQLKQDVMDALYEVYGVTVNSIDVIGKDLMDE